MVPDFCGVGTYDARVCVFQHAAWGQFMMVHTGVLGVDGSC
jgi:hypothetical protein